MYGQNDKLTTDYRQFTLKVTGFYQQYQEYIGQTCPGITL